MILHLLRALFVLLMAAVGFFFVRQDPRPLEKLDVYVWLLPAIGLSVGVLLVCIDILSPRKKLAAFAGTFPRDRAAFEPAGIPEGFRHSRRIADGPPRRSASKYVVIL